MSTTSRQVTPLKRDRSFIALLLLGLGLLLPALTHGAPASWLKLDGVNDYVETSTAVIPTSGNFTVEFWANCPGAPYTHTEILSQGSAGNALYIGTDTANNIRLGDAWGTLSPALTFPSGGWHHFALVRTSTNAFFYIDGVLKGTKGSVLANPAAATGLRFGRQYGTFGEYWQGSIGDVRIWNRDLSLGELNQALTGTETNLVAWWRFNEGAGATCTSIGGTTIVGTIVTAPSYPGWLPVYFWYDGLPPVSINGSSPSPVGALTLPAAIGGVTVTGVSASAFANCSALTSVTFPTSVTKLGASAFATCSALTNAEFLGNAPALGAGVFAGAASGFTVAYHEGATGFTSPTWLGYPTIMLKPEIAVEQPASTGLTDGASLVDFGSIPHGSWAKRTFTIRNSGTATLSGLALTVTGANPSDFTVSALPATALPAGNSMTFTVSFAPAVLGARTAVLHLASNDADESPFDLSLAGGATPITFTDSGAFITCTGCDAATVGELEIPAVINGKPVTTIAANAFQNANGLTVVTIPTSVTTIGSSAFNCCFGLTSVTIPSSVTSIGEWAFSGCTMLKNLSLPSNMTALWTGAFAGCQKLTEVTLPANLVVMSHWVFNGCTELTSLTIPAGVTYIGYWALTDCSALASIEFLGNAPSLDAAVFAGAASGFTVYVHNGSTGFTYPTWTGFHCVNLDTHPQLGVELSDGTALVSGVSTVAFGTVPAGATTSRTFTIRNSGTDPLTNLAFSLTGANAGDFTASLAATSVAPGASTTVTVTFGSATKGTRAAVLHLASNDADHYPFDINLAGLLMALTFTDDGTAITITGHIGTVAGPLDLPPIINGKPVAGIGGSAAFYDCAGLTSVTLPPGATSVGDQAFRQCTGLTSVTLPPSVTTIGIYAFGWCSGLTDLQLPPNLTSIGTYAFARCLGLKSMAIPPSVTSIGIYAFGWCYALESVTFSPGLSTIGGSAFSECWKLGSVTIPSTVTTIAPFAFAGCDAMETITVDPTNPSYCDLDGLLFNKAKTVLVFCPAKRSGTYVVPTGVTTIATGAFTSCSSLTGVLVPASVTSIERQAFASCPALKSAEFLGNAPAMGTNVFLSAASDFTVFAHWAAAGFATPTWQGYPCVVITPYSIWQSVEFTAGEIAAGQTSMETDFDRDGSTNLLEYAFAGNPKVADAASIAPKAALVANSLQISFICDAACEGITYTVQSSTSLAPESWTDIAGSIGGATTAPIGLLSTVTDPGSGARTVTVTDTTAVNVGPRRFLRVKVTAR